ncbi:hypothetical protein BDZ97DRAFT_1804302 [Flammula alnicola]|nr:hypothetical protein BDZ97DRAFT_1804302 [Flammula alnicola]
MDPGFPTPLTCAGIRSRMNDAQIQLSGSNAGFAYPCPLPAPGRPTGTHTAQGQSRMGSLTRVM